MNADGFFEEITRHAMGGQRREDELLALMIVYHTHDFHCHPSTCEEIDQLQCGSDVIVCSGLTRSTAASVIASLFEPDDPRSRSGHWNHLYSRRCSYEIVEQVSEEWMVVVRRMIDKLLQNERIAAVVES